MDVKTKKDLYRWINWGTVSSFERLRGSMYGGENEFE